MIERIGGSLERENSQISLIQSDEKAHVLMDINRFPKGGSLSYDPGPMCRCWIKCWPMMRDYVKKGPCGFTLKESGLLSEQGSTANRVTTRGKLYKGKREGRKRKNSPYAVPNRLQTPWDSTEGPLCDQGRNAACGRWNQSYKCIAIKKNSLWNLCIWWLLNGFRKFMLWKKKMHNFKIAGTSRSSYFHSIFPQTFGYCLGIQVCWN